MPLILNLAAYRFVPLDQLPTWRRAIRQQADAANLRGTVLLSAEGINLFVAGAEPAVRQWWSWLTAQEPFADMEAKESWSEEQPFNRMLVRLKREIISFAVDGIEPERQTSPKISADELKAWLDAGRDVTLLDVRNDYEVRVGTFSGAQAIGIDHFRDFPAAVQRLPVELKDKPIVMFCTGGIRCEKAGPLMEREGFREIYQLDGGILKYLELHGGEHYDGACFVFDQRVALDGNLQPAGFAQCFACQAILSHQEQQSPLYDPPRHCPHCYRSPQQKMRALIDGRIKRLAQVTAVLPGSIPHENVRPINVPLRFEGATLMQCLQGMHPHLGEEHWAAEFAAGRVVRGRFAVDGSRVVRAGQRYGHLFPDSIEPDVNAEIAILWEDESIVVVNKPAPLPMHPSGRFNHNTLCSLLGQVYAPEILRAVHRLDANTTGLVVLAKSKAIATQLQRQFGAGEVNKTYVAHCHGWAAEEEFTCDSAISRRRISAGARQLDPSGDAALTQFRVLGRELDERGNQRTLVQAIPKTGRTNQIRLHLWSCSLPIVGDSVYLPEGQLGKVQTVSSDAEPMRLHAWRLTFSHPRSGEPVEFCAPLPQWAQIASSCFAQAAGEV
jgi:UPF0176 protein